MSELQATELVYMNKDHKQDVYRNSVYQEKPDFSESFSHNQTELEEEKSEKPCTEGTKNSEELPKIEQSPNTIKCGKCELLMSYPVGSYFVCCPTCKFVTATVELLTLNCQFCKVVSYFPKLSKTVQCQCGAIYAIGPIT